MYAAHIITEMLLAKRFYFVFLERVHFLLRSLACLFFCDLNLINDDGKQLWGRGGEHRVALADLGKTNLDRNLLPFQGQADQWRWWLLNESLHLYLDLETSGGWAIFYLYGGFFVFFFSSCVRSMHVQMRDASQAAAFYLLLLWHFTAVECLFHS